LLTLNSHHLYIKKIIFVALVVQKSSFLRNFDEMLPCYILRSRISISETFSIIILLSSTRTEWATRVWTNQRAARNERPAGLTRLITI